ncbi:MAG TPA: histidine phosphatase family protein [Solirubrobacterales bacterium]|nr:histidine phosphatase family protein [Solirubrobacterales bacterium]
MLLIRHGQASFGAADYDVLSATGERQAEVVAAALARRGVEPSRIVTGSLRRQIDTAAALAGPAPEVDRRWDEFDPNDVLAHHSDSAARLDGPAAEEGEPLTSKGFQAILEPALAAWIEMAEASPARQSWPQFSGAGSAALTELAAELGRGETAVVVTSGGTIAALVGVLLGAPALVFGHLNRVMVNAGITKVAIGAGGVNLIGFNDHSHLEEVDRALITYR